jgi:hypothetical protein
MIRRLMDAYRRVALAYSAIRLATARLAELGETSERPEQRLTITDFNGRELAVGAHVTGWYDDIRYTGILQRIDAPYPGCSYRHVTVIRDDNHAAHRTFSDALTQES